MSVHPSLIGGRHQWDADILPRDEFDDRQQTLRERLRDHGGAPLVVYGDARDFADLAHLSHFVPRSRWGLLLLPATGPARLVSSWGPRDLPAQRAMTCVQDVYAAPQLAEAFQGWAEAHRNMPLRIVGAARMPAPLYDRIVGAAGNPANVVQVDDIAAEARSVRRPRQIMQIKRTCAMLARAVEAARREASATGGAASAADAALNSAWSQGATDVRCMLAGTDGRFVPRDAWRHDGSEATLYLAVLAGGAWADHYVPLGQPAEERSIRAALEKGARALSADRPAADAVAALEATLGAGQTRAPGGAGRILGYSLDEDRLSSSAARPARHGEIVVLHAGRRENGRTTFASLFVEVGNTNPPFVPA